MEMGMGLHGEPGVRRSLLASADSVAEDMVSRIPADLPAKAETKSQSLSMGSEPRRFLNSSSCFAPPTAV